MAGEQIRTDEAETALSAPQLLDEPFCPPGGDSFDSRVTADVFGLRVVVISAVPNQAPAVLRLSARDRAETRRGSD